MNELKEFFTIIRIVASNSISLINFINSINSISQPFYYKYNI